jgi:hypothetical protein
MSNVRDFSRDSRDAFLTLAAQKTAAIFRKALCSMIDRGQFGKVSLEFEINVQDGRIDLIRTSVVESHKPPRNLD